jgi:hypothetical protein
VSGGCCGGSGMAVWIEPAATYIALWIYYVINEQNCTLLVKGDLIYITNKEVHALLDY